MRVSLMDGPDGLLAGTSAWRSLADAVTRARPDVLVMNEMPFGPWLSRSPNFDQALATESLRAHDTGLAALEQLRVPTILSSRPVQSGDKLANEAFVLAGGVYRPAHHKQYFPAEPGWYEDRWFNSGTPGFSVVKAQLNIGFLICTEIFFNEWARHYRRCGAHLIVVPRSSGLSVEHWRVAAKMAAVVSGCYVVSANRAGNASPELCFGGHGFAIGPDASVIGETSATAPIMTFEVDLGLVERQQSRYPCYIPEIPAS